MRSRRQAHEQFGEFVEASSARLVRTAYLVVGDLAEAEDLAQETLAKVAQRWPRVRRMESPYGYARRVLFHLALGARRRRSRDAGPVSVSVLPEVAVDDESGLIADRDQIARAISELPPRQRATLVLRFWEQLSEAETAAALGCSVGTVKSQTFKALRHLRESFMEHPQGAPRNRIREGSNHARL